MGIPERLVSRRAVLASATAAGVTILLAPGLTAAAAGTEAAGEVSTNGWPMQTAADSGLIRTRPVAGSGVTVAVRVGAVETVLVHVIRRFHYEIGTLQPGEVAGFQAPGPALTGYRNNHASGTAIDIRPGWYPAGSRTVSGRDLEVIRAVLAECAGVVAWGGDLPVPDEAHFQIDVASTDPRLPEVAGRIRGWNDTPGLGAGVVPAGT
ncbi:M15 family metallopeptidase [Amycolatopsis bartoniae]|uniref:Peptidase M15C domain-containing protein n=1 Tax=Amycolatopsis bartoniae TaxID=941986 RepID=A0A8H9M9U7_9PSEU|nr:M15 family metallopeptidase [Amycolatopsis bartoniae]TVT10014.1 M15 family metallopeptidase [Amycolatopsis bartoniae]GHF31751.1 hypothetical protein GCM10017566_00210 [Amycolatopsis bartoniae]